MRLVKILIRIKKDLKRGVAMVEYIPMAAFQVKIKEDMDNSGRISIDLKQ